MTGFYMKRNNGLKWVNDDDDDDDDDDDKLFLYQE